MIVVFSPFIHVLGTIDKLLNLQMIDTVLAQLTWIPVLTFHFGYGNLLNTI